MYVDPKAPADHPAHPSQISAARTRSMEQELDAMVEALETHRTAAEAEDSLTPSREELARRAQLVAEYDEDCDPECVPTLVDLTGQEHRWHDEHDGWQPVIEPEADAEADAAAGPEQAADDVAVELERPAKTGRHRKSTRTAKAPALKDALAKLDAAKGKK